MKYLLIFSIFLFCKFSYGTGQVPDYLVYKGDTLAIFSNPLEKYFEKTGKRELIDFVGCVSTACWRGYKAIWELKEDKLYLIQVTSCHNSCGLEIKNADLKKMFGNETVFANWFTGKIIVPQGERVQYIHMGYASIYEKELHISFKDGIKTNEKTISNGKIANKIRFEKRQREIAKKVQDTLFQQVKKAIVWDTIKTPYYDLCDEKYILTYNKKGKLKKVWVDWWWNITDDKKCRKEIKKALKPINISYLKLPKRKIKITFIIFYNKETGKLETWMEE
ncbi:hypothetical protein [Thalassobellus sediminis]|uniref:hypothetical protein n=1 Tax=Thalassobellus sediminis TaxID=3367753 RepID=UPI0037A3518B